MKSIQERLEEKKLVVGNCWRFLGYTRRGQGRIGYKGKIVTASRLIMHLERDFDLDSELQINHMAECKFPDCWNPEHLYVGTQFDNMSDRSDAITHCPQGHEYTPENTIQGQNGRICKECKNSKRRIWSSAH